MFFWSLFIVDIHSHPERLCVGTQTLWGHMAGVLFPWFIRRKKRL